MSIRRGPPKHQNKFAWNPDAGRKKNEKELGGKFRPYSDITGVCGRCKDQIDWKRKYGKYKPLTEPAKCAQCGKRAVRQAYHMLCSACAKERGVCAKCSHVVDNIVGRDIEEVEAERKELEEAIKNSRERDRRTLLRAMNTNKRGETHKVLSNIKEKVQSDDESDQSKSSDDDNENNEGTEHRGESGEDIVQSGGGLQR
uniref:TSA: Wollemia nobilis Ref_Wollemi_Transcript_16418_819 transcribed RNA sequence n=1 Tax=Wollemia nobilis TaxID=56998 RepID=A0A0C9QNI1_9CONI